MMNVYDVALDFVLLDAFSDLENPPSTVMAVLQNTWLTDGMKKSVSCLLQRVLLDCYNISLGTIYCSVVSPQGKAEYASCKLDYAINIQ